MTNPRTMLINVRTALRATTQAWHDVHKESEKNRHVWRETNDHFRKRLKVALTSVFKNTTASALFRETIRSRFPQTLPIVLQFAQERNDALAWLARNPLAQLEKKVERSKKERDTLQDNTKRSSPALHNHMYQIGDLLKVAAKSKINTPGQSYEENPEVWLEHLRNIENALMKEEAKTNFWQRMRGENTLHAAKRAIEKSTREGFPTMMLHVRESLDLQRRLLNQFIKSENDVKTCLEHIEKHHYYERRLQELENLGETGYIIAHAKEAQHVKAVIDSLDADFDSSELSKLFLAGTVHTDRQTGIELAHAMLSGWNETLQNAETVLSKRGKDVVDYPDDPVGDMCAAARRGAQAVQRWLLTIMDSTAASLSPVIGEGPLETDRMISILRDMDNKIIECHHRFSNHPVCNQS